MKTTFALLIAGLFLLATPVFAFSHENEGRFPTGPRHTQGWMQERHGARAEYRYEHRRQHEVKKHHRRHLREYRWEHRHYYRPRYADSAVILTAPRIIFRIDW